MLHRLVEPSFDADRIFTSSFLSCFNVGPKFASTKLFFKGRVPKNVKLMTFAICFKLDIFRLLRPLTGNKIITFKVI